jgi:hypothetical protein
MMIALLAIAGSAFAWDGSGTATDPYLISNDMDWRMFFHNVRMGISYEGKVFRLTTDLSVGNFSIGTEDTPFDGTFDGDGHTLTFSAGTGTAPSADRYSPFLYVSGATIRHLTTEGTINTSHQYAGGIVSMVVGDAPTTLYHCTSRMEIYSHNLTNDAHGGLVGAVVSGGLTIENCVANPYLDIHDNCAVMVGWSNVDVTIRNSMSSSQRTEYGATGCATFARMAGGAKLTL